MAAAGLSLLVLPEAELIEMAKIDVLEERVGNHIKFFWAVTAFQILAMGGLLWLILQTKSAVNNISQNQANASAEVAAAILKKPSATAAEATESLAAVNTILRNANPERRKVSPAALKPVAQGLVETTRKYPDLPQSWETTGVFVGYKSQALIQDSLRIEQAAAAQSCSLKFGAPTGGTVLFTHCHISLEDVAKNYTNMFFNGHPAPFQFVNCLISYSGGAVPSVPMIFRDCVFQIQVQRVPPLTGQQALLALASALSPEFTVPAPPSSGS